MIQTLIEVHILTLSYLCGYYNGFLLLIVVSMAKIVAEYVTLDNLNQVC